MTTLPHNWIQRVTEVAVLEKAIPLWGYFPFFSMQDLEDKLCKQFNLSQMKIKIEKTEWCSHHIFLNGLGASPLCSRIDLSPLRGSTFFLMGRSDANRLLASILHMNWEEIPFADPSLYEGLYAFLLLQILDGAVAGNSFSSLSPKIAELNEELQIEEDGYCLDISISLPQGLIWARLVCPETFHSEFRKHFLSQPRSEIPQNRLDSAILALRIVCGHVSLSISVIDSLKVGDFIILDRCTYDPEAHRGSGTLFLQDFPLFQLRFKSDQLKLMDYAAYQESDEPLETSTRVGAPMNDRPIIPHSDDHLPDQDFGDSDEVSENELFPSENSRSESSGESPQLGDKVFLTLTVEVGRIDMSLESILRLQPGNVLELGIRPEQGIWLTVKGKKIARGELLAVGEVLGVKVLQIGCE